MTTETKVYPGNVILDPDTEHDWEILDHNLAKETAWAYVLDKAPMAEICGSGTKVPARTAANTGLWKDHLAVVVTYRIAVQRFGGNYYLLLRREG